MQMIIIIVYTFIQNKAQGFWRWWQNNSYWKFNL